jgi:hypothetical protein
MLRANEDPNKQPSGHKPTNTQNQPYQHNNDEKKNDHHLNLLRIIIYFCIYDKQDLSAAQQQIRDHLFCISGLDDIFRSP